MRRNSLCDVLLVTPGRWLAVYVYTRVLVVGVCARPDHPCIRLIMQCVELICRVLRRLIKERLGYTRDPMGTPEVFDDVKSAEVMNHENNIPAAPLAAPPLCASRADSAMLPKQNQTHINNHHNVLKSYT